MNSTNKETREIICLSSGCKYYYENICLKEWQENEHFRLDKESKCCNFQKGRHKNYKLIDMEKDLKECIECLKEAVEENAEIDTVWLQQLEDKYCGI